MLNNFSFHSTRVINSFAYFMNFRKYGINHEDGFLEPLIDDTDDTHYHTCECSFCIGIKFASENREFLIAYQTWYLTEYNKNYNEIVQMLECDVAKLIYLNYLN